MNFEIATDQHTSSNFSKYTMTDPELNKAADEMKSKYNCAYMKINTHVHKKCIRLKLAVHN